MPLTLKQRYITSLLLAATLIAAHCRADAAFAGADSATRSSHDYPRGLIVRSHQSVRGIIQDATVYRGGELRLRGVCDGNIVVRKGGVLWVRGVVYGTVTNDGGKVFVHGVVDNLVKNAGTTLLHGVDMHKPITGRIKR